MKQSIIGVGLLFGLSLISLDAHAGVKNPGDFTAVLHRMLSTDNQVTFAGAGHISFLSDGFANIQMHIDNAGNATYLSSSFTPVSVQAINIGGSQVVQTFVITNAFHDNIGTIDPAGGTFTLNVNAKFVFAAAGVPSSCETPSFPVSLTGSYNPGTGDFNIQESSLTVSPVTVAACGSTAASVLNPQLGLGNPTTTIVMDRGQFTTPPQ